MKIRNLEPGDPTTWRQALGVAIHAQRCARGRTLPEVARRCKVSQGTVENWERGIEVPTADEWKALCQGINRSLNLYTETWNKARAEARAQRDIITRSIEVHANGSNSKPLTAKLGDKIAAIVPPKPGSMLPPIITTGDARTVNPGQPVTYHAPPVKIPEVIAAPPKADEYVWAEPRPTARDQMGLADDGRRSVDGKRKLPPPVPPGGRTAQAIETRKRFVRELLRSRPNIRTTGKDSVIEAVRHRFNIGISPEFVDEIRDMITREDGGKSLHEQSTSKPAREPANATIFNTPDAFKVPEMYRGHESGEPPPVITGLVVPDSTPEGNIRSAVELIREAIPNLMTFSIEVDEDGEATVHYQVREVKVTTHSGSLKVSRK